MARIRWHGTEFSATPIELLRDGTYRMMAREHTGRTVPGTMIVVTKQEIIEMAAAETPSPDYVPPTTLDAAAASSKGLAQLEHAMAQERKTLPAPAELIAKAHPKDGVSVPVPPS